MEGAGQGYCSLRLTDIVETVKIRCCFWKKKQSAVCSLQFAACSCLDEDVVMNQGVESSVGLRTQASNNLGTLEAVDNQACLQVGAGSEGSKGLDRSLALTDPGPCPRPRID